MDERVTVHLTRRCMKQTRGDAACQTQHVDGAEHAGLHGVNRVHLIMDRRRRTGEVIDLVRMQIQRIRDVVPHHLETRVFAKMSDIAPAAGEEVVDTDDFVPFPQQALAQVRTQKTGTSCHDNAL
jgi:hypothetical protein